MDEGTLQAMRAIVAEAVAPEEIEVAPDRVLVVRADQRVVDLERYAMRYERNPRRAVGTSVHHTLDSLTRHAKRHGDVNVAAAFVDAVTDTPRMVVVYNYHTAAGDAGWCDHRAEYAFPLSDAWKRWTAAAGKALRVEDFARLLEDGIGDVWDPKAPEAANVPRLPGTLYATPTELLALADGLTVNVQAKVGESRRLDNGTHQVTLVEEHETTNRTGTPVRVPNAFLLGVPVFVGGAVYGLPVRLRYRVVERMLVWSLVLHNAAEAKREAVADAARMFGEQTGLPVLFGTPEPAIEPPEDDEDE